MKYIFLLLCFSISLQTNLLTGGKNVGVSPESNLSPDLLFTRFTSKDGLPDNRIRSFLQDDKGFLWIGTMNGIAKYDGYTFKKYYKTTKANSISGNWINSICEDASRNLWIGTLDGLNVFNTEEESFTGFRRIPGNKNSLFCNSISTLQFDGSGKLWIGTKEGLATFNPAGKLFTTIHKYPFNTCIYKIIRSKGDYIWIATAEGIVHFNVKTNKFDFFKLKVKPNPYGDLFWSLFEDNGNLYISTTSAGLIKLVHDPREKNYGSFEYLNKFSNTDENLKHTEIFDICKSGSGDFWLGTSRGLAKIENLGTSSSKISFYRNNPLNNQSLSSNIVYKVFIDKNDILWCGTELGLNKLDLHLLPFHYYTFKNPKSQGQVRSIYTRDGQTIWLGTDIRGLYQYNSLTNSTKTFKFQSDQSPLNFHRSLLMDSRGDTWLGTLGGVLRSRQNEPFQELKDISGIAIFSFLEDSKGNTWIGTNNGLFKIKPDRSTVKYSHDPKKPNSLTSKFVRSLYEDHNGRIWIGFETSGLSCFDPEKEIFTHIEGNTQGERVFGHIIYSILEYPKNVIWAGSESGLNKITIGTQKNGVYTYSVKNYFESDGLSDKSVNGILSDNKGYLWISTIKGLLRFDVAREQFQNYLPILNFSFSCYYKLNDNKLLFGTSDGFVIFDPAHISTNTYPPAVVISDLKLFNREVGINSAVNDEVILEKSISETSEITLGYMNNIFTLGFTGLHFSNPEDNTYAFMMEGFNKDWIYTKSSNRSATYTNLDPGTYYFKVKAANSFGKWNNKPAVLKITVLNPPWKTWWAILSYCIVLGILLFYIIRYISIQSKQKHQLEIEHMLRLKEEELHKEQLSFFTNITHELQTPLTLINGSIERHQYKNKQSGKADGDPYFLSLIHQQSSRLSYLVNQLLDLRKAEAGYLNNQYSYLNISALLSNIADLFVPLCDQKKLDYSREIEPDILGWTDKDKLEKIIFNLLSNAFKHSGNEQSIAFSMYKNKDADLLEIIVANSGCQLSPDQLHQIFDKFFVVSSSSNDTYNNGIGLAFTRQLVTLLKGSIDVVNENGWISFRASLPLTQADGQNSTEEQIPLTYTPSYLLRSIAVNTESKLQPSPRESNKMALMAELEQHDRKTILIVEDEAAIRYLLRDLLGESYIIYEAENGRQALKLLKNTLPNLIISDIMMPDIDGLELCNSVKESPDTCHIPFILLSARGSLEQKTEGYGSGADAYIPKPFDTVHLQVRVRKLLEYRQRLNNLFKKDDLSDRKELVNQDKLFLSNMVQVIEDNIENTDLDAIFLENQMIMSKMQLYRKLKTLSDMAPSEFIRHVRLQKAVFFLLSTSLTVSEIFYRTGFNNQSYFFREFKKQHKCSPNEYRTKNRI